MLEKELLHTIRDLNDFSGIILEPFHKYAKVFGNKFIIVRIYLCLFLLLYQFY